MFCLQSQHQFFTTELVAMEEKTGEPAPKLQKHVKRKIKNLSLTASSLIPQKSVAVTISGCKFISSIAKTTTGTQTEKKNLVSSIHTYLWLCSTSVFQSFCSLCSVVL